MKQEIVPPSFPGVRCLLPWGVLEGPSIVWKKRAHLTIRKFRINYVTTVIFDDEKSQYLYFKIEYESSVLHKS